MAVIGVVLVPITNTIFKKETVYAVRDTEIKLRIDEKQNQYMNDNNPEKSVGGRMDKIPDDELKLKIESMNQSRDITSISTSINFLEYRLHIMQYTLDIQALNSNVDNLQSQLSGGQAASFNKNPSIPVSTTVEPILPVQLNTQSIGVLQQPNNGFINQNNRVQQPASVQNPNPTAQDYENYRQSMNNPSSFIAPQAPQKKDDQDGTISQLLNEVELGRIENPGQNQINFEAANPRSHISQSQFQSQFQPQVQQRSDMMKPNIESFHLD
mmetsp:Transcript_10349/g.11803  ORF Transcript_10349/g.11803 Transcript_10349/m.11803 type:complete len:269 (+) Transcript_10349:1150-1956(+)